MTRILTLADIADMFGESVATARRKIAARARAGFPKPLPKVFPTEPYKWPAPEVAAWLHQQRSGAPAAANDTGPASSPIGPDCRHIPVSPAAPGPGGGVPVDIAAARARLLGSL
jgi:predicted DNA-binding transcriptional regulator AlpA